MTVHISARVAWHIKGGADLEPELPIKKVEQVYKEREAELRSGDDSIVLYERCVREDDDSVLRAIEEFECSLVHLAQPCRTTCPQHARRAYATAGGECL
jgi:hypothetical protein